MKKIRVILASFSFLVFIVTAIIIVQTYFWYGLLTGNKTEIIKATITIEPDSYPEQRIIKVIEDKDTLYKIYELIQETKDIKVNPYPRHFESIQTDRRFCIEIVYNNGKTDLVNSSENTSCIYRHLDTRGSSGDSGYVSGENDNLWNFVNNKELQ